MVLSWTVTALRDLNSLHDYIAADNPRAAAEVVEELLADMEALKRHPEMGRKGRVAGTRELVVSPYVIVYRPGRNLVELVAILHGARKWPDSF